MFHLKFGNFCDCTLILTTCFIFVPDSVLLLIEMECMHLHLGLYLGCFIKLPKIHTSSFLFFFYSHDKIFFLLFMLISIVKSSWLLTVFTIWLLKFSFFTKLVLFSSFVGLFSVHFPVVSPIKCGLCVCSVFEDFKIFHKIYYSQYIYLQTNSNNIYWYANMTMGSVVNF